MERMKTVRPANRRAPERKRPRGATRQPLRRAAGEHAKLLNRLVEKVNDKLDAEDRLEVARLKERLGHSRREVLAGMVFGVAVAFFVCAVWDFWKV